MPGVLFLRVIAVGVVVCCCRVGSNEPWQQQQHGSLGRANCRGGSGGTLLGTRLRGGGLTVRRTDEELNTLRRVRKYQREMAMRGSSRHRRDQEGDAAGVGVDPEPSGSAGDMLIDVRGRLRRASEVGYEELIADGYDPAWDDSECCRREYEKVRQKMLGNAPWSDDDDEESSVETGDIVEVGSTKFSMSQTPLYTDLFNEGPRYDDEGRRQQKSVNMTVSGHPVVPFRELFGDEAEMGSEWDLSVDSKGEVRLDEDSGSRSDEVKMGKAKTVNMGDAESCSNKDADGEKTVDSEDENEDGDEDEDIDKEERDENGRTESQAITDFFRDPPPGVKMHQAGVVMSGEEYANHVEHHFMTGNLYPEKPKSLQGDCRKRLVRFAETLRDGVLRTCVHSLATMASPPPCSRSELLQLAKELPGGRGKQGARHDLGPHLWCIVEGMLKGDAFSTVSQALTDLVKKEAELLRGSSKHQPHVLDVDSMFLTEREVRDARMDEIRRTPYHLLKINVTDSVTGQVSERNVGDLDPEAQYYVANGGIESREDLYFPVPPEWEDDVELPLGPGDRVMSDGTILRCPFPNDTVPAGTPYPLMGHWLGNDHAMTKLYREFGQEELNVEDSGQEDLNEEDYEGDHPWQLPKTQERPSARDREMQIRRFVEQNNKELRYEWDEEREAKTGHRRAGAGNGLPDSAEGNEEKPRGILEELASHGAASRASVKRMLPKPEHRGAKSKGRVGDELDKTASKGAKTLFAAGQQIDPSVFADPI